MNWKAKAQIAAHLAGIAAKRPSRQERWDKAHLHSVGCKISRDEAARLKARCDADGITRYELIRYMILMYLAT